MSRFSTMGVKIHKQQVKELAELGIHNRKKLSCYQEIWSMYSKKERLFNKS